MGRETNLVSKLGQVFGRLTAYKRQSFVIFLLVLIGAVFTIGVGVGSQSASGASDSGTSIPIKKGGTGATDKTNALTNLLPDFTAADNGKLLGLTSNAPAWVDPPSQQKITIGNDYSTTEQPVMIYDSTGTLRQQQWVDGKPIYRRAFNNTVFGDVNSLAAGDTKLFDFRDAIPNMATLVNECLFISVNNVADTNRIGSPTTASNTIKNTIFTSWANPYHLLIKNNDAAAFPASGMSVVLNGWVEYTKTAD